MSTVLQALNQALHAAFEQDSRVHLIGEDLLDPYGGAFKVSQGLSTQYPDRVWTSPVSEAAITGLAGGMALRGLLPIVEIMFGDFSTLIADQLVNGLTKFRAMYNNEVDVPVLIRTPMGGRRGYGPTHSQTLEKLFLGIPGLRVLAPNRFGDPGQLLLTALFEDPGPVLFIENKLLYTQELLGSADLADYQSERSTPPEGYAPTRALQFQGAPQPAITLAVYGYMADLARQAQQRLAFEHEIFTELVLPSQLAPFGVDGGGLDPLLLASIQRTSRLLTIEEGAYSLGWGAELGARAAEAAGGELTALARVAAEDAAIPASVPLEQAMLPGVDDIVSAARKMV